MNLFDLGWDDSYDGEYRSLEGTGLVPGRVIAESRRFYEVCGEGFNAVASVSGHFLYTAAGREDYPTVGDWVALRRGDDGGGVIEKVLRRRTLFSRKSTGRPVDRQVIAANIDIMCVVCALDGGRSFNPRGIERYLVMVRESGAGPILVLNKADLCEDKDAALVTARSVAGDVPLYCVSAVTGEGMDEFSGLFPRAVTAAFTGPSGVGKSAIINRLLGEDRQTTGAVREEDRRGRHTTTRKELFFVPSGGMVIDTPGLRELQAWGDESSVDEAFTDIAEAALCCRFRDCSHRDEPGCAVQELMRQGIIPYERYQNYMELKKEMAYLNSRCDEKARMEKKRQEKELSRRIKEFYRDKK